VIGSNLDPYDFRRKMGRTATVGHVGTLKRRRIIERPRLFALLGESRARVRTLVAPAGYGKTTLAEQWVQRDGRRGAWFTARRSSTDVAALALGIARAAAVLVEGCDSRLREHLRAVPAPAENVETLAEILGEDLDAWPSDGWLVVDDYQEIARAAEAERFVAALVSASPAQLLIASRQRPSWVTARGILYGEFLELNQTELAMDSAEAAEVLAGRTAPSATGLVALANGWPAVIGLASVSSAEIEGESDEVPESLYRFFAEEVFGALGEDVQAGLTTLSIAPVLDRELAAVLLGAEGAESVCAAALDVGILVERGAQLELHPLARSFLDERGDQLGLVASETTVAGCLDHYRARRDWDAAFDLITRFGLARELEALLIAALDELLDTARLPTIETWCAAASESGLESSALSLARAEVALRHGRHAEAQTHAEAAASRGSELAFRSLSVAGRAAHLASREEIALELYRRAEAAATTEAERRDALWGQLICATELELPEAGETLQHLNSGVDRSDVREVVRAASYRLNFQVKLGTLDLADADAAYELLGALTDPLIVSSFQSTYSGVLALTARYEEALEVADAFLETARRYRLDFAVPYALGSAALACAGLRIWNRAEADSNTAITIARRSRNAHGLQLCFSVCLRVLAQRGRHQAALALDVPPLGTSLPAARAEVLCSRALVLAAAGRVDEALVLTGEARGLSRAVEPAVLLSAVEAISALKRRNTDAIERIARLEETAFSTGAVDLLVTAYRSTPELLAVLLRASPERDRLVALIRRAKDEDLAGAVGEPFAVDDDPIARLSPRERDVYDLLREGLTNRQIAKLLFIEESTVKAHAHHIYDKLGTRSRTALTVQAMLERADQATSAIETAESEDGS
jgi:ATP/maltotriose-dependent transcriptional regulator MalT